METQEIISMEESLQGLFFLVSLKGLLIDSMNNRAFFQLEDDRFEFKVSRTHLPGVPLLVIN